MKGLVKKIAFVLTIVMLASSASLILACCQPAPKYTIRYVLNGGTMDQSTISLKEGEDIPSAIPTKSGYNFAGWYQSAKFSGSAFEQTTMPAQNIVLYAKWEKQQGTYSITYQLNGGTMGQSSVTLKEGDPIPSVTPTRNGYKFVGWYQSADFSGNKFEDTVMPAQNIELYAKWEKEVVESITFTQEQLDNHNAEIAQYSQDGHLYIHYKRFESTAAEYEKFNLWVWPCSKTGIEFDWMRDKDGNIIVDEMGFVTADIDLTKTYTNAGNSGNVTSRFLNQSACDANFPAGGLKDSANYPKGDETIGFLIVLEESKQAQGHWQSDGGTNTSHLQPARITTSLLTLFAMADLFTYTPHKIWFPTTFTNWKTLAKYPIHMLTMTEQTLANTTLTAVANQWTRHHLLTQLVA
ncbi:MAG: InlB B-repeat-containing protein [Clostridia bacterium]|nr:InlB B-repeat-containing protein [Clostridia bacterium]